MDFEALLVVGGFVLALGVVLLSLALLLFRYFGRREGSSIRVTRLGFFFGVAQTLVMFTIVGWGFFQPETFLGRMVAHPAGAPAIIILVGIVCYIICLALKRSGVVLYYRSHSGV